MIIKRNVPWHARSTFSRSAHVLERLGLALTGASCGLFVAEVSGSIDLIGSAEAVLAMMLYGATGFYLGINLPQVPPDHRMHLPRWHGLGTSADIVELLTAAGTFLTAVAAVVSISSIVLGETVGASSGWHHLFGLGNRRHHADRRRHHRANKGSPCRENGEARALLPVKGQDNLG